MTIDDERRAILSQVAAGTLDPSHAAEQLAELERRAAGGDDPSGDSSGDSTSDSTSARPTPPPPPPPPPPLVNGATKVVVEASLRGVQVIGDPTVREAVAEGPHIARHEGDTLVIESEPDEDWRDLREFGRSASFSFSHWGPGGVRMRTRPSIMNRNLVVRMNPDLHLDARVEAGSLTTRGVRGPITARVSAGSARFDGFAAPLDIDVAAGSVKATGRLDRGDSHIRCDAGSVKLHLEAGSSVRVTTEAHLGSVTVGDRETGNRRAGLLGADAGEALIGAGSGRLDIEVNLGSVRVTSDE